MRYTDEQIARVIHEANSALQVIQGDPAPSQPWDCEDDDIKAVTIKGVANVRRGMTPRMLHDAWCHEKRAQGWTHGPEKDAALKTHPCLVPYWDLPPEQRTKNYVFVAIVEAMS